jgi:hypothetical protein
MFVVSLFDDKIKHQEKPGTGIIKIPISLPGK